MFVWNNQESMLNSPTTQRKILLTRFLANTKNIGKTQLRGGISCAGVLDSAGLPGGTGSCGEAVAAPGAGPGAASRHP